MCLCACESEHVCLVSVRFLPLKLSRGQRAVCTNTGCLWGCVVSWFLPLKQSRGQRPVGLVHVCKYVCVCVCTHLAAVETDKAHKHDPTAGGQVHQH